jgi:hypothetical protein
MIVIKIMNMPWKLPCMIEHFAYLTLHVQSAILTSIALIDLSIGWSNSDVKGQVSGFWVDTII